VIYAYTGYAVDPLTNTQLGIFPGLQIPVAVAVDDPNEKVFFLDNGSLNTTIVGFDQTSYIRTGTLSVTAATTAGRDLVRWGTNGFAVSTQNQVLLLTGALP
jgi:DNA-binding beta-propeller fold protein YncE